VDLYNRTIEKHGIRKVMLQFKKTARVLIHIWKKMKNMTQIIYKMNQHQENISKQKGVRQKIAPIKLRLYQINKFFENEILSIVEQIY
jgi:hypothetical protein